MTYVHKRLFRTNGTRLKKLPKRRNGMQRKGLSKNYSKTKPVEPNRPQPIARDRIKRGEISKPRPIVQGKTKPVELNRPQPNARNRIKRAETSKPLPIVLGRTKPVAPSNEPNRIGHDSKLPSAPNNSRLSAILRNAPNKNRNVTPPNALKQAGKNRLNRAKPAVFEIATNRRSNPQAS